MYSIDSSDIYNEPALLRVQLGTIDYCDGLYIWIGYDLHAIFVNAYGRQTGTTVTVTPVIFRRTVVRSFVLQNSEINIRYGSFFSQTGSFNETTIITVLLE
jgi:hypothetical protein